MGPCHLARGTTVRKLRVVYGPLSEHLRFEIGWQYPANQAAGEQIRILELTERVRPSAMIDDEFWMLGHQRAVLMTYDDGRYLHGDTVEGLSVSRVSRARDAAWAAAETLDRWWARHPEYHRDDVTTQSEHPPEPDNLPTRQSQLRGTAFFSSASQTRCSSSASEVWASRDGLPWHRSGGRVHL